MEQFTGKKMQSSAQPPFGHLLEADSATNQNPDRLGHCGIL